MFFAGLLSALVFGYALADIEDVDAEFVDFCFAQTVDLVQIFQRLRRHLRPRERVTLARESESPSPERARHYRSGERDTFAFPIVPKKH